MQLYLVQHGEAVPAEQDADRPLTDKGQADARAMAAYMHALGVSGIAIWHSDKLRSIQTAAAFATTLDAAGPEPYKHIGPNADIARLAAEVSAREADLLVVSHQPYLGRLVSYLVAGRPRDGVIEFVPGTAACLQRGPHGWRLHWLVPPSALSGDFKEATA